MYLNVSSREGNKWLLLVKLLKSFMAGEITATITSVTKNLEYYCAIKVTYQAVRSQKTVGVRKRTFQNSFK